VSLLPPPVVESYEDVYVVRDDLLSGGTKRRVAHLLFDRCDEVVWQSPAEGMAQVALAYGARETGKSVAVFTAARKNPHPYTLEAIEIGAKVHWVRPGRMTVVTKRARDYAAASPGRRLVPLGLDVPTILWALSTIAAEVVDSLSPRPSELWSVAGKGVLSRALQMAAPDLPVHAVRVGRGLRPGEAGRATLYEAPEEFGDPAEILPPFPSSAHYDAKAWRFVREWAKPRALFWNVY
jgi:hypothetical protein